MPTPVAGGDNLGDSLGAPARHEKVEKQPDEEATNGRGEEDVPPGEFRRQAVDPFAGKTEKDELDETKQLAKRDDAAGRHSPGQAGEDREDNLLVPRQAPPGLPAGPRHLINHVLRSGVWPSSWAQAPGRSDQKLHDSGFDPIS